MTLPKPLTEYRSFAELRAASDRRLQGTVARFNTPATIGTFIEVIRAGAFKDSLSSGKDILALIDHDTSKVLGRTRSGTLQLNEDLDGLQFNLNLPNTTAANDILELVQRNDAGGMSFGFTISPDGERWDGNRRELRAVNLIEVSVISAWPAYPETTVVARARTPKLNLARLFLETCR